MSFNDIKAKLIQLEKDLEQTQSKAMELIETKQTVFKNNPIFCYFDHSLILEHEPNSNLIMGSFHVKNLSSEQKHQPLILIKIDTKDEFNFTGKFLTENQRDLQGFQWRRIHLKNLDQRNHFCFKPTNTNHLYSDEMLSFQNFQIKIPIDATILVEGFVYFNESNDGVPASNSIRIGL